MIVRWGLEVCTCFRAGMASCWAGLMRKVTGTWSPMRRRRSGLSMDTRNCLEGCDEVEASLDFRTAALACGHRTGPAIPHAAGGRAAAELRLERRVPFHPRRVHRPASVPQ